MVLDDPIDMFRTASASNNIEIAPVVEKTRVFIVLNKPQTNGERVRIDSGAIRYHDSWTLAHAFLISRAHARIERAVSILKDERDGLTYINSLTQPKEEHHGNNK